MHSVVLLCWAVLTLHSTVTCYHLQQTSLPSGAGAAGPDTRRWLEAKPYFIRKKGNQRARKPVRQGSEEILNFWKDGYQSCFSLLHIKSQIFLCLDPKGKFYPAVFDSNEDCRFRCVRNKRYVVLHFRRGDVLLVNHRRVRIDSRNLPKLSGFVYLKRDKTRTHHRKRRSWHTDPSDPLGVSEYQRLSPMRNWRSDPEHGGHVSKETIMSVDDPLEVLLSHNARTPTLEKHKENRKVRF